MSNIVLTPEPVLHQVAKPVTKLDKKIMAIIADMVQTLKSAKNPIGVGLAAPQIGLSLRIFLIRPKTRHEPEIFINPEIIKMSKKQQSPEDDSGVYEGCLSIPNHYAPLKRAMTVTVKYHKPIESNSQWDLVPQTSQYTGFAAHIIQHEMDHLNGTLFVDRVLEQKAKLFKVTGKNWEEVEI